MSDEKEERRKQRAELRRARAAQIAEMQSDQCDEIEDIIDEKELGDNVVIVKTDLGVLACKKAEPDELDRFFAVINGDGSKRRRGKGPSTMDATQALVRSARIYPDAQEFERILMEYKVCWNTLGEGIVDLAGATFEADVRKN
jgi:hypothetical protein